MTAPQEPATAANELPRCPKCGAFMSAKDDPDGPIFYCIRCGHSMPAEPL